MLEPETIWRIIDEGSTPAIALIAYFLWQLERTLKNFITKVDTLAEVRDAKLDAIAENIDGVIKRLAGMKNGGNNA